MMEAIAIYESLVEERPGTAGDDERIVLPRGETLLARLHQRGSFLVDGVAVRFGDDAWDFSAAISKPVARSEMRLDFASLGEFADIVKLYCFEKLAKTGVSVSTLRKTVTSADKFLAEAELAGYAAIPTIPYSFYVERFSEPQGVSYGTFDEYRRDVRRLLEFYEANFTPLPDRRCLKLLAKQDPSRRKASVKAGKRDEIEQTYLEEMLCLCDRVAADATAILDDRIVACCLKMYSQIGHRTGEMGTFKAGAVSKIEGKERGRDLWHAKFKHAKKKGQSRSEWTPTTCYMNDFALEAFRLLEEICRDARTKAGTDALVVFECGALLTSSTFSYRYRRFAFRNLCVPPFLNNPERRNGMKAEDAASMAKSCSLCKDEAAAKAVLEGMGLSEGDLITYPEVRMFRNTVCTGLYRQKVSLKWIGEHLNHLHKDMEAYYNRADREIDEAFSNEIYRAVVTEGARITGPNGDAFEQMIYDFIDEKKLRAAIERDPEAVIAKLSKRFPLKKKSCGMCIRCAGIIPCAVDGLTDEIVCAVGVCPNHASTYWMAPGSYADAKETALVVSANADRGRTKEARHELGKLKRILSARLSPEVEELSLAIAEMGAEKVIAMHPELKDMVANIGQIQEEIELWTQWTL